MIVRSIALVLACGLAASLGARAQPSAATVFQNVRIFDGKGGRLSGPSHVLVRGNKIERIASTPILTDRRADTVLIEGGGRTLMPGLIDVHWHAMLVRPTAAEALDADIGYTNLLAGAEATATLLRGFTSVRDLGGPSFGLKRAIDEGIVAGPRIFPSGAIDHGDQWSWRLPPAVRIAARPRWRRRRGWRHWAPAWSPTVRTRCACACVSNSCWAPRRSS